MKITFVQPPTLMAVDSYSTFTQPPIGIAIDSGNCYTMLLLISKKLKWTE